MTFIQKPLVMFTMNSIYDGDELTGIENQILVYIYEILGGSSYNAVLIYIVNKHMQRGQNKQDASILSSSESLL